MLVETKVHSVQSRLKCQVSKMCIPYIWIGLNRPKYPYKQPWQPQTSSPSLLLYVPLFFLSSSCIPEESDKKQTTVWKSTCEVSMATRADATHPLAPQGSVSLLQWSSLRGSVLFLSLCAKSSQLQVRRSRPGINSCTQNGHVFRLIGSVGLCKDRLLDLCSSCVALENNKKHNNNTKETKKTTGCVVLCSFAFDVIWGQCLSKKKCRSSFCEILNICKDTDVQKKYEMKSFMVVKSFTLLNYFMNGKEKQEKKRTLLRLL